MNAPKNVRYFVPFCVILMLLITPLTIQAAGQAGNLVNPVYLPLITNFSNNPSGNLSNGGVYVGEGRVGLEALANSLSGPISVPIARTDAPTQTMPSKAQVLSDYYQIGANSTVSLTTSSPLILAFPVPPGANTAQLDYSAGAVT